MDKSNLQRIDVKTSEDYNLGVIIGLTYCSPTKLLITVTYKLCMYSDILLISFNFMWVTKIIDMKIVLKFLLVFCSLSILASNNKYSAKKKPAIMDSTSKVGLLILY